MFQKFVRKLTCFGVGVVWVFVSSTTCSLIVAYMILVVPERVSHAGELAAMRVERESWAKERRAWVSELSAVVEGANNATRRAVFDASAQCERRVYELNENWRWLTGWGRWVRW